jgi:hypothetical protein
VDGTLLLLQAALIAGLVGSPRMVVGPPIGTIAADAGASPLELHSSQVCDSSRLNLNSGKDENGR